MDADEVAEVIGAVDGPVFLGRGPQPLDAAEVAAAGQHHLDMGVVQRCPGGHPAVPE